MKEEALKLADELDNFLKEEEQLPWGTKQVYLDMASTMIRRLVEELDCSESYIKQYQLERKPTITKLDGKVVAVTMTDDEHRVHEVLWEAPKPLSDDELFEIWKSVTKNMYRYCHVEFARAIEERHGIKNVQKT